MTDCGITNVRTVLAGTTWSKLAVPAKAITLPIPHLIAIGPLVALTSILVVLAPKVITEEAAGGTAILTALAGIGEGYIGNGSLFLS